MSAGQVQGMVDSIGDLGGWDPDEPESMHQDLQDMHKLLDAVQEFYQRASDAVAHIPRRSDALGNAAQGIGSISSELESELARGVLPD